MKLNERQQVIVQAMIGAMDFEATDEVAADDLEGIELDKEIGAADAAKLLVVVCFYIWDAADQQLEELEVDAITEGEREALEDAFVSVI